MKYQGRSELFQNLDIWKKETYRSLQGTYPVINLSFANVKEKDYERPIYRVCKILQNVYKEHSYLMDSDILTDEEKRECKRLSYEMQERDAGSICERILERTDFFYKKPVSFYIQDKNSLFDYLFKLPTPICVKEP